MAKQYASLESIENDRKITKEADYDFLHQLQSGLLLALKERGRINEMQYCHAQNRLNRQHQEWTKKFKKGGSE